MYIGNLESYQGIDLLLNSFQRICKHDSNVDLVIIGGVDKDSRHYRDMAEQLGIGALVHLLGPRPVDLIGQYMKQADILVSPRTQGANTPMKIYSYLDSGRAVLATRLPTHTQVLDDSIAVLAEPNSRDFANAMLNLLADEQRQSQLAAAAKEKIQKEHSYPVFRTRVHELYSLVDKSIR
jgi:glycosyltransferase involved in cell wall biosynthesis